MRPLSKLRVLYFSHAPDAVYDIVRRAASDFADVVTLTSDSDAERRALIAECDVVICSSYRLSRQMINAGRRLRLVAHQGVGYHDTVDMAALAERGIRLTMTPEGTTLGVAEHAVLLTLAALRRATWLDAETRRGEWRVNTLRSEARELNGKTIAYVGMGRIGRATAQRFQAFGTTGVYFDPGDPLDHDKERQLGLARCGSLHEALARGDVTSLHLPLTPETYHLIDGDALKAMPPGAILINTSRGPIVDEAALISALQASDLGGAGLDVFEVEPPRPDNPLLSMHNVVVTPHVATATRDSFETKMRAVFENVGRLSDGRPLLNEVRLASVDA
jgi:phosphoglycerate dehydrogenase-like enzyme